MNTLSSMLSHLQQSLLWWRGERHDRATACDGETDRIQLVYTADGPIGRRMRWQVAADGSRKSAGFDFHSLVWERNAGKGWRRMRGLSAARFQGSSNYLRWLADVYSFDAVRGSAIVKVGEANQPRWVGSYRVDYSWRVLDIASGRTETRQHCSFPNEPYRAANEGDDEGT